MAHEFTICDAHFHIGVNISLFCVCVGECSAISQLFRPTWPVRRFVLSTIYLSPSSVLIFFLFLFSLSLSLEMMYVLCLFTRRVYRLAPVLWRPRRWLLHQIPLVYNCGTTSGVVFFLKKKHLSLTSTKSENSIRTHGECCVFTVNRFQFQNWSLLTWPSTSGRYRRRRSKIPDASHRGKKNDFWFSFVFFSFFALNLW